jgi:hypothetical protein
MALVKIPPRLLPWLLVIFGILGCAGLVGILTQNNIWPFKQPVEASPPRAPASAPAR